MSIRCCQLPRCCIDQANNCLNWNSHEIKTDSEARLNKQGFSVRNYTNDFSKISSHSRTVILHQTHGFWQNTKNFRWRFCTIRMRVLWNRLRFVRTNASDSESLSRCVLKSSVICANQRVWFRIAVFWNRLCFVRTNASDSESLCSEIGCALCEPTRMIQNRCVLKSAVLCVNQPRLINGLIQNLCELKERDGRGEFRNPTVKADEKKEQWTFWITDWDRRSYLRTMSGDCGSYLYKIENVKRILPDFWSKRRILDVFWVFEDLDRVYRDFQTGSDAF